MVSGLIILMRERFVTVLAGNGRSMPSPVVDRHWRERNLLGENFRNVFTFRHDVLVEMGHDIGTAVNHWRGLILREVGNSVAAVATDFMFVYYMGFGLGWESSSVGVKKDSKSQTR